MQNTLIISLNSTGKQLAAKICAELPHSVAMHRPKPFAEKIQQRFLAGHNLVFICSTAIAIRTISHLIQDKHTEPCVLALDDQGQFVIPLLSGHQGGGHALAKQISDIIKAQCVFTGEHQYTKSITVLGMGCIKNCDIEAIEKLYQRIQMEHGPFEVQGLASIDIKKQETAMLTFAKRLNLPIDFYPAKTLQRFNNQLSERSDYLYETVGCYGVAEAAALAHCQKLTGCHAKLIINKHKSSQATLAVARSYHHE